jgi:acetyl-CoA synthetase
MAGKRLGPGEIESALMTHPAIKEAAAIGIPDLVKGEALICFIVLNQYGLTASQFSGKVELEKGISQHLVSQLGSIIRPKSLYFIESLPKTRSGKIVRSAIRKKYLGDKTIDLSSIENPDALKEIDEAKSKIK